MLAKLTAKNQLTLPKAATAAVGATEVRSANADRLRTAYSERENIRAKTQAGCPVRRRWRAS